QGPGDLIPAAEVGCGAGPAAPQRVGPPGEEGAEPIADGLGVVAEVGSDAGRRPAGIGEEDHLDAVAGTGPEVGPSRGVESRAGGVGESDADHAELYGVTGSSSLAVRFERSAFGDRISPTGD